MNGIGKSITKDKVHVDKTLSQLQNLPSDYSLINMQT